MESTISIGARGEAEAVRYLRSHGFMIRDINWRNGRYEIDIIAQRWDVVHFVEVKSRKVGSWSAPEEAINRDKFKSLSRAASAYLALNAIRETYQFDLIAIDMDNDRVVDIRHIEKAMQYSW